MGHHKWEHGDEYLKLNSALRAAKKVGDEALYQQLQARIQVLDDMMWRSVTDGFPELAPYHSVVEALEKTALRLGAPFPNLADARYRTGDGKFIFGVSDGIRSIQIFPLEDRGYHDIEIYERGVCYKGQTRSLEEAARVLNQWFMEGCSIEVLHTQFPWISSQPFQLPGPRMTLE
jgi:hypothetical protein